jgi:hypothetical protein
MNYYQFITCWLIHKKVVHLCGGGFEVMNRNNKPMLSVSQQIDHLEKKGVMFNLYAVEDAKNYLRYNNNYFKLTSYRKNYDKYQGGDKDGKYVNLDFAYLKDLSIIDMKLRYVLLQLALDIEHYAKLKILRLIEDNDEDGYSICEDFFEQLSDGQKEKLKQEVERNINSEYCGELYAKYCDGDFSYFISSSPVWVFLEIISFGRLLSFYKYCADKYNDKDMNNEFYLLLACKDVRKAAAHSSCILNNLHLNTYKHKTSKSVLLEISKIRNISKNMRTKRMSNERIRQIVSLIYTHKRIVTSRGVRKKAIELLKQFDKRMMRNYSFYDKNDLIQQNFNFLHLIIDNLDSNL